MSISNRYTFNQTEIRQQLARFGEFRVAVVGDLMLDKYISGHASRISPEAPVPVVRVQEHRSVLGGAANVLRNLTSLGMQGVAYGVVGNDADGQTLSLLCEKAGIDSGGIMVHPSRPTTVKTRVISDGQQVVCIDEEDDSEIDQDTVCNLLKQLEADLKADKLHGIIIEDYHKGVVHRDLVERLLRLTKDRGILTALDPHPGNIMNTPGLTVMTPNRREAFALAGAYYRSASLPLSKDEPLLAVARTLLQNWQPELLVVTLGAQGMAVFRKGEPVEKVVHIPTVAREVFDVSGAGDTVIATFTAARLAGMSVEDAIDLANHAGGVVVGHVGTKPVDPEELIASYTEARS